MNKQQLPLCVMNTPLCQQTATPAVCDEYTVVSTNSNSRYVRWVDEHLNLRENFLGFYEIPNIKCQPIVNAIKDALIRFNLAITDLRCRK